jgi:hypothetical protein
VIKTAALFVVLILVSSKAALTNSRSRHSSKVHACVAMTWKAEISQQKLLIE